MPLMAAVSSFLSSTGSTYSRLIWPNFGEQPELVERQRRRGRLLGRRRNLQRGEYAGGEARGNQADVLQFLRIESLVRSGSAWR
jgi:hypothetical protein